MLIQTELVTSYINETKKPEADAWFYAYTGGSGPLCDHRQEVCRVLLDECNKYKEFPVWNQALLLQLLPNMNENLKEVILYPILGTNTSFDAKIIRHDRKTYVLIDLLHIADYTESVKQMTYILHNLLHQLVFRYYFERTSYTKGEYRKALEDRFFYEGLILYASWNEDHTQYVFQNPAYEAKKEKAFGLLYQALQVQDSQTQHMILKTLQHADLWDRFTDVAGMFFLDDVFHEYGMEKLISILQHNPRGIFHMVFGE